MEDVKTIATVERERERERVVILTNNKQAKKLALLSILKASTKHGNV